MMEHMWLMYWLVSLGNMMETVTYLAIFFIIGAPCYVFMRWLITDSAFGDNASRHADALVKTLWRKIRLWWIASFVLLGVVSFVPSRGDVLTIILGSVMTSSTVQQIPPELIKFLKDNK